MGNIITDRLALIIDAQTAGAVTEIKRATAASTEQATAQERAALASARQQAAVDKLALSEAKLGLVQAKAAGDAAATATAQEAVAAATAQSSAAKAQAAVASDRLAVADARAAAAAGELAATSGAGGNLLSAFGIQGATAGEAIAGAFAKAGPVVLALIGGKLLFDGVKQFVALGDEMRSIQLVTGGTATEVSQLVGQIKSLGIEPDVVAKGLARLGAAIGDGTTKLGQYGIAVQRNANGNVDMIATFDKLRDAYNASTDAATKDAIAKQVGLRGAVQLAPLLALNTSEIKALNDATKNRGEIFSQSDINNAHDLSIAGSELKLSMQGLEVSLARFVIPALTSLANRITDVVDAGNKLANSGFGKFFGKMFEWANSTQALGLAINVFAGSADRATSASQRQQAAAILEADAEDKLTSALLSEYDAQKAVRDAALALSDARMAETDATKKLNDLLASNGIDQKAVIQAQKELASASGEVTRAQQSEQRAQESLNKAREKASALDLAEAQNKIALAGDKIGQARAAEEQAKEKLDALLGSGAASAGEIASAQADVQAAHDNVTQAILDQQQASVDLQKTQQKGTDQDPAVVAAQQTLQDAHQSVTDAITREKDAQTALVTAQTPDPQFAENVAKARNDLARAHNAVADGMENQVAQALNLQGRTNDLTVALAGQGQALDTIKADLEYLNSTGVNADSLLALVGGGGTISKSSGQPLSSITIQLPGLEHGGLSGARAAGGPVNPHGDYLVGEKGPEILRMGSRGGYVQPSAATAQGIVVNVNVDGNGITSTELAQEIARETAWSLRTSVLPRLAGR